MDTTTAAVRHANTHNRGVRERLSLRFVGESLLQTLTVPCFRNHGAQDKASYYALWACHSAARILRHPGPPLRIATGWREHDGSANRRCAKFCRRRLEFASSHLDPALSRVLWSWRMPPPFIVRASKHLSTTCRERLCWRQFCRFPFNTASVRLRRFGWKQVRFGRAKRKPAEGPNTASELELRSPTAADARGATPLTQWSYRPLGVFFSRLVGNQQHLGLPWRAPCSPYIVFHEAKHDGLETGSPSHVAYFSFNVSNGPLPSPCTTGPDDFKMKLRKTFSSHPLLRGPLSARPSSDPLLPMSRRYLSFPCP